MESVDAPFCPDYFIQFSFLGPRAHLRQASSLGYGPLLFLLFIESLIYLVFNQSFVLIFCIQNIFVSKMSCCVVLYRVLFFVLILFVSNVVPFLINRASSLLVVIYLISCLIMYRIFD